MNNFTHELPQEQDFLNTLIEYVTHKNRIELVALLKKCSMSFMETSTFTKEIWNTYWCSLIFSLPMSDFSEFKQDIEKEIKEYCSEILPSNCGFLIKDIRFIPQISKKTTTEQSVDLDTFFEDHKNKILEALSQARFTIWIAMAWFRIDDIYDLLVRKTEDGLDVRVIVSRNKLNIQKYKIYKDRLNIKSYPEQERNMMHHKFCVIDLRKVIHGSFNWTPNAESNKEAVVIVDDSNLAEEFSDEFKKLYTALNQPQ